MKTSTRYVHRDVESQVINLEKKHYIDQSHILYLSSNPKKLFILVCMELNVKMVLVVYLFGQLISSCVLNLANLAHVFVSTN